MAVVKLIVEFVDDELTDSESLESYLESFVDLARLHPSFRDYKIKRTH